MQAGPEIDVENPTTRHGRVARGRSSAPAAQNHLRGTRPAYTYGHSSGAPGDTSGTYSALGRTGAQPGSSGYQQCDQFEDARGPEWGGGDEEDQQTSCRTWFSLGEMFICCDCTRWCRNKACCNRCVVGPAWPNLIVVYLVILGIAFAVFDSWQMTSDSQMKTILAPYVYAACGLNLLAVILLSLLAFSDPGILPRYTTAQGPDWTYSMQGLSYRPPGAIFCKKTKVIIEEYDHFCGMSGTVVGRGNVFYFRSFVVMLLCALTLDAVLLTLSFNS